MNKKVTLNSNGDPPWISIEFGHTRLGAYRMYLANPVDHTMPMFGKGRNDDPYPDRFPLGESINALKGRVVVVDGVVSAVPPESDPIGSFNVRMRITQGGKDAQGSPIDYPDPPPGALKDGLAGFLQYIELN